MRLISRRFVRAQAWLWLLFWLLFSRSPQASFARAVFQAGLLRRWFAFRRGLSLGAAIFAVRDVITPVKVARNSPTNLGSLAAPANGAAFTQANGQVITGLKRASRFMLLVYNSKAGAIVVTIQPGANPPATEAGVGALTYTCPTTAFFTLIGPLDGSRFLQKDGTIQIDTDAGATGTMWCFELAA